MPDWFKSTMPPFLDNDEVWVEYNNYLKTITEDQWHGITVGDGKVVLRERVNPTTSTKIEPSSSMIPYAWGTTEINAEPDVQVVALSYRILESVVPHDTSMGLEARLTEAFARLIIGRLPVVEWTLTDAFILQWCSIYREKYLS